ncbi:MAG: FKBP-type peptidyl-prolyl cis-trans isomerase [Bacteroidia bacterium]
MLGIFVWAQSCVLSTTAYKDYIFRHGKVCVGFSVQETVWAFAQKGKIQYFPFPKSRALGDLLSWQTKLKNLKTPEVLIALEALQKWDSAKKDVGFTYTASGLGYKILQKGSGDPVGTGKRVKVHYRGYLVDGRVFDDSYQRGQPIEFTVGSKQVIPGWEEGIALMAVGTKGVLRIPPELGYGARGVPGIIPPNAVLYFDVEVVGAE